MTPSLSIEFESVTSPIPSPRDADAWHFSVSLLNEFPSCKGPSVSSSTSRMLALAGLASVAAFGNGPAAANMDLAKAKNCTACHAVDRKLIGPAYQDVARKYANDKDAAARLTKKVIAGGVGVWGQVPMPPNPQATPDEAAALVRWVLSLK